MSLNLYTSEEHVLRVVWQEGPCSARRIAEVLAETLGWSKTTTYTVIKKCVDKGFIRRTEPGFLSRRSSRRRRRGKAKRTS